MALQKIVHVHLLSANMFLILIYFLFFSLRELNNSNIFSPFPCVFTADYFLFLSVIQCSHFFWFLSVWHPPLLQTRYSSSQLSFCQYFIPAAAWWERIQWLMLLHTPSLWSTVELQYLSRIIWGSVVSIDCSKIIYFMPRLTNNGESNEMLKFLLILKVFPRKYKHSTILTKLITEVCDYVILLWRNLNYKKEIVN